MAKGYLTVIVSILLIFVLLLWMDNFYAVDRLMSIGGPQLVTWKTWLNRFIFILEYILAASTLFFLLSLKKRQVSIILILILWGGAILDLTSFLVYGRPADISTIAMLNAAAANYSDACQQYAVEIIHSVLRSSFLFVPLVFIVSKSDKLFKSINNSGIVVSASFCVLITIFILILLLKGAQALVGFPKGFNYLFSTLTIELNSKVAPKIFEASSPSDKFSFFTKEIKNIILVVDESIEYSEFRALSNFDQEKYILDLGRSYSAANCSAPSNYIIRKGFWESAIYTDQSKNIVVKETDSLFTVAKRQNFRTYYFDNQNVLMDKTVRNYFTDDEIENIDEIIEGVGDAWSRDMRSLHRLKELLIKRKEERKFIFINKIGAHFPYQNNINPNLVSGDKMKDYRKAVQLGSIDYLKEISGSIDSESLVLYTSDHGQSFNLNSTHCNSGSILTMQEFTVPFVLVTRNDALINLIKQNNLFNKTNHLMISETVRNICGEDLEKVRSIFERSEGKYAQGIYGQPFTFFGQFPTCKSFTFD